MFLGNLGHGFVFASKKSDHLVGILGVRAVDTFTLARNTKKHTLLKKTCETTLKETFLLGQQKDFS